MRDGKILKNKAISINTEQFEDKFEDSVQDVLETQALLDDYLARNSHSLTDEIDELFREIAALQGKSVVETVEAMRIGSKKYQDAIATHIVFENDLPIDINLYVEKIQKIAEGIESCWDLFSLESHNFFIQLSHGFLQAGIRLEGWQGFCVRVKLFLPCLKNRNNLFFKYRNSFTLIPKAVNRSLALRQSKSTRILASTARELLEKLQYPHQEQPRLSSYLKNLGRDPEEQLRKNQPLMAWAKARIDEIEKKRGSKEES